MGKLHGFETKTISGDEEEEEEEATWVLGRASKCLENGDLQIALSLLTRAHRLHPDSRGLPEILAVAEVCVAAASSLDDDACSCGRQQHPHISPNWYHILKDIRNFPSCLCMIRMWPFLLYFTIHLEFAAVFSTSFATLGRPLPSITCFFEIELDKVVVYHRLGKLILKMGGSFVDEKSDMNTIKKRYRQLALLLHPDKNKHTRAEEAFKLVSEAYAHLSDNNKRTAFNLYLKRRQCKKCSSMTRSQTDIHDTSCFKKSLKGKNHGLHGFYFSSDFYTAEWKLEQEKLSIFRQRAQAKVDKLAQILKDRRSRWNDEMDNIKGRPRKRTVGGTWQYMQEDDKHESRLHSFSKKRNSFKENGSDSILVAEYKKILSQRAELKLLEELHGRKSMETQTPEVLRRLDELLVALKEEISASGSRKVERTKLHDPKEFVTSKEKMKDGFIRSCSPIKNSCSDGKLKEEEITVIDDFLAGLQCFSEDNQTETINTARKSSKYSYSRTSPACTKRSDSRIAGKDVFKERSSLARDTTLCDKKRTAKDPSIVTQSNWKLPLFNGDKHDYEEEKLLHSQKKRSEQLMRTLERLREETKSVAATLESLKEHSTADSNHVNGFCSGSYIIAM